MKDKKQKLLGTWQLVETIVIDQDLNPKWMPVENGYKYTFQRDNAFFASKFSKCSTGHYFINSNYLFLDYDCNDVVGGNSPGTFKEELTFESGYMFLKPTYLTCIEGCGYKFKKVK